MFNLIITNFFVSILSCLLTLKYNIFLIQKIKLTQLQFIYKLT